MSFIKATIIFFVTFFVTTAQAAIIQLVEVDIYGNGTNKGYTLDIAGYDLIWMDLDEVDQYSYNQIKAGLPSLDGWRIAKKNEVFDLFSRVFEEYDLIHNKSSEGDSISFNESVSFSASTYIQVFDVLGGRLGTSFDGLGPRFTGFFDSGLDGAFGAFSMIGHDFCPGSCSQTGFGVSTFYDPSLTDMLHNRQAIHDSTMLVRTLSVVDVSEPNTLLMFFFGVCLIFKLSTLPTGRDPALN